MRLLNVLLVLALTACTATPHVEPTDGVREQTIYVVSHGWHAGIVVRVVDLPPDVWPEGAVFPRAKFLEIGWGDRGYYTHPDPGASTALRAALLGGPSVLHLVGLRDAPQRAFPQSEVAALAVSDAGLRRLVAHVAASFERDARGAPRDLGAGLYGESRFFASRERFSLFNTCNVWTARVLREAGLAIGPSLTAGGLMAEARRAAVR